MLRSAHRVVAELFLEAAILLLLLPYWDDKRKRRRDDVFGLLLVVVIRPFPLLLPHAQLRPQHAGLASLSRVVDGR